jgi:hypothetical protein
VGVAAHLVHMVQIIRIGKGMYCHRVRVVTCDMSKRPTSS